MCQACGGTCGGSAPRRRARTTIDVNAGGRRLRINDAGGPAPLHVARPLLPECAAELGAWARRAGLADVVAPDAMHVTLAYSRAPVDWFRFTSWFTMETFSIGAGGPRRIEAFSDKAIVLRLSSDVLTERWREFRLGGCSWDHPQYAPHITVAKGAGTVEIDTLKAFSGDLRFGPEEFGPLAS